MLLYITVHLISKAGHSKHFTPVLWPTVLAPCRAEMSARSLPWNSKCAAGLAPPTCETPFPSPTMTFHDSGVPPNGESTCKQARCSWEETTFGEAGCWLRTFLPEERKINTFVNFTLCLILPAEHPSISSNKAKFYKIIKLVSQLRRENASYTKLHSHTQLLVAENIWMLHCMRVHKSTLRLNNTITVVFQVQN